MKFILACCFICFSVFSFSQVLIIEIDSGKFQIDESNLLIVSHIENIGEYANLNEHESIDILFDGVVFSFLNVPNLLTYSSSYSITNGIDEFILFFTQLPIVTVNSDIEIIDEPKVLANFTYTDDLQTVNSLIGIELRGGFSQTIPKKTFDLEFWEDEKGDETLSFQFGSLRDDDDWILDGMYNEPLRIRSYISHKLWIEIHQLHYSEDEPEAKSGADVMFVELFLNHVYNGIYALSEQVDKKQLQIKSYDDALRGELYKGETWGATTFTELPDYDNTSRDWGGYEYKYPKENQVTDWENLYNFTEFVMFSTNTTYVNEVWNQFNKENAMDYFIFLNLLRATDNTGKNIYLAKYNIDYPYFYTPWDLDGTWGIIWNGTNDSTTNDILSNGFFQRNLNLNPNLYKREMGLRWFDLRNGPLSLTNLLNNIDSAHQKLTNNNVYSRESMIYGNYDFDTISLNYMINWLEERIAFLDSYFEVLLHTESIENTSKRILFPNPSSTKINITNSANLGFSIFSSDGRLIKTGTIHTDNYIIVSDIKNGIYLLNIENQTFTFIKK